VPEALEGTATVISSASTTENSLVPEALEGTNNTEALEVTGVKRLNKNKMTKGYMYILECSDGSYYTGSTIDLDVRLKQHQNGEGANHTKKHLPVKLVYFEMFQRIDEAFYREKQVQGWSRKKKEALINKEPHKLPELSIAYRDKVVSSASTTENTLVPEALEGTATVVSSASTTENTLVPEALEGTATVVSSASTTENTLVPEALEGTATVVSSASTTENTLVPEALEGTNNTEAPEGTSTNTPF